MEYNAAYHYLRKRHVATLSHEDFFKILKENGRFETVVEVGRLGELTDLGLPYRIVKLRIVPRHERRDLRYSTVRYVARKPQLDAPYASMNPADPLERSETRFDLGNFDPRKEKEGTRWKVVDQLDIPSMQCPRCKHFFAEGFLFCTCCGLQLNTSTDLRKACQVVRLEELARVLGYEVTMDLFGDDMIRARN